MVPGRRGEDQESGRGDRGDGCRVAAREAVRQWIEQSINEVTPVEHQELQKLSREVCANDHHHRGGRQARPVLDQRDGHDRRAPKHERISIRLRAPAPLPRLFPAMRAGHQA